MVVDFRVIKEKQILQNVQKSLLRNLSWFHENNRIVFKSADEITGAIKLMLRQKRLLHFSSYINIFKQNICVLI